ncbi:alpha/beta fold hydrolase [Pseudonocardia adelaidensis]|uniref:Alpha/beta fold hydrolase n=1 Tax=Pseudonocardia adelaidensis TaxID=648754 RepID=A0ABP9NGK7_9PSEU
MTTFVLVPGGWHGGWDYQPLTDRLRRLGHSVHAITLPGLEPGQAAQRPSGPINLDTHIDYAAEVVQSVPGDVVLCGHSYGGMPITGVADRMPERIRHLVYIDAFVPHDGESWWDLANEYYRSVVIEGARGDGLHVAAPPGLDPRAVPHPMASFLQEVRLTGAHARIPRRTLIFASGWDATPFREQYDRLRDDPAWETHELATRHNVMRDAPDALTAILTG